MSHDIEVFDSDGFAQFLLSHGIVRQGTEKFMVHWVRGFFQNRRKWVGMPWHEQLPLFTRELSEAGRYAEWQVRQAEQAVRLYYTAYLARNNEIVEPRVGSVGGSRRVMS